MQKIYTFLAVLFSMSTLLAQDHQLSGTVSDGSGTLPGVAVLIEGTDFGTMTDLDGAFSINIEEGQVAIFSFMGYKSQKRIYTNQDVIHVVLQEDSSELQEVIINVPYGTANKKTYTGSVGLIQSKSIERSQVSNVSKVLEGSVAGVQSFSASGQPGSEATIRIRGVGSINASSDPLYVVDGVPYDGGLSSIAASDIESISVLKDATAATLYGSRAANGVIMITTKQGVKESAPQIEITTKQGVSNRARDDYNQVSTNQYMEMYWEAIRNGRMDSSGASLEEASAYASANLIGMLGINPYGLDHPNPVGLDGKLQPGIQPLWNDNWSDALSQKAHYTDVNLRVSGGGAKSKYYFSGGYLNDQGYVLGSGFKRFNLRSNVIVEAKDWLELGLNVSAAHSIQDYPKQEDSEQANVIGFARGLPSFYPIYQRNLATGEYLLDPATGQAMFDYGAYRASSYKRINLVATMPLDKNQITRDVATFRTHAQVKFLENLKLKTSLNVDYNSTNNHNVSNPDFGTSSDFGGAISRQNTRTVSMTFNTVLNYNWDINDRNTLNLMGGQEFYQYNSDYFGGVRQQIIMQGYDQPDAASRLVDFYGKADEYKMLSFFGNAQYALDQKYYLSASYRRDGSSRFSPSNRWGDFWSVGASWRIIDEAFLTAARDSYLSNALFRISYGAQGNDKVGYYAYQSLFQIYNNLGESGLVASRIETPDLSWETNLNLNIGLDLSFFTNRLNTTIEYFERSSKDLLFDKDIPPSLGFTSVQQNIGSIKNYGLELSIDGYPIMTDTWKLQVGLNMTTYKNKITSLPAVEMLKGNKKWIEGGSIYDFYLKEWAGINPENGNPQWYIQNGDGTKTATEDFSQLQNKDRIKSGNSLPNFNGGFWAEVSYKNWQLATNFVYTIGGKIYNRDKISLMHQSGNGNTWSTDMLDRWTPDHRDTDVARLTTHAQSAWTNESTRFLVDRSFLKLKNVTLSYNVPQELLRKANLSAVSVFLQGENLFTISKTQGFDPEQTFDGTTYYRYPAMRTVSLGLNVKL